MIISGTNEPRFLQTRFEGAQLWPSLVERVQLNDIPPSDRGTDVTPEGVGRMRRIRIGRDQRAKEASVGTGKASQGHSIQCSRAVIDEAGRQQRNDETVLRLQRPQRNPVGRVQSRGDQTLEPCSCEKETRDGIPDPQPKTAL